LNGAVDFTDLYGEDVFARVVSLLPLDVPVLAEPQLGLGLTLAPVPTPGPDATA
jgi:hypothetical protein